MKMQILALLLATTGAAQAQQNPNDNHARHNAQSPYYVGPRDQPQQMAPQPTGWWEKTWGAIAPSPKGGVLGTAIGAKSKREAERLALADCQSKGGQACSVSLAYHNQCGSMAIGEKKFFTARAGSESEARAYGLELCEREDANCQVYYSACTEPVFHRY